MNAKIRLLSVFVLLATMGATCETTPTKEAQFGEPIQKYLDMKGEPTQGVAVEITEMVDDQKPAATVVEMEIINALRQAGIPVVAKGKPEFVVSGAAEAKFDREQDVYGITTMWYSALAAVKVVETRTGTILGAVSDHARMGGTSREVAANNALKKVAQTAAEKVVEAIKAKPKAAE